MPQPSGPDELIDKAARALYEHDASKKVRNPIPWDTAWMAKARDAYRTKARALADAGLLADGLQAELESDWTRLAQVLGIGATEPLPGREEAIKAAARLYLERDELKQDLVEAERFMQRDREQALRATAERDQLQERVARQDRQAQFNVDMLNRTLGERDERPARIDAANLIVSRALADGLPAGEALRMIDRVLEGKTARALQGDQPEVPHG